MNDYEKYEKGCKRIRKENERIISQFIDWLEEKKLTEKTIRKHVSNIDLYINDFLLYEDAVPASEGVTSIDMFLAYWAIRKGVCSSKNAIKENASSIKKFYQFMFELKMIEKDDLLSLSQEIKDSMPEWLEKMDGYDNRFNNEMQW